jgi:hypothetical protein
MLQTLVPMESIPALIPLIQISGMRSGWLECQERRSLDVPILHEKSMDKNM